MHVETDLWTTGFKCSCMKVEAASQDKAGSSEMVGGLRSTESDKA